MASAKSNSINPYVSLIALLAFVCSCTDEPSSVTFQTVELLKERTWSMKSVEVDGVDKSDQFEGLKLKFDDQVYTVSNGGLIWGGNDTLSWTFQNNDTKSFAIGTGPEVHIEELTKSGMKLRVLWDPNAFGAGSTTPARGLYIFEFQ